MEGELKRRVFDEEFKLGAIRLVKEEERRVSDVVRDLGIDQGCKEVQDNHQFQAYEE